MLNCFKRNKSISLPEPVQQLVDKLMTYTNYDNIILRKDLIYDSFYNYWIEIQDIDMKFDELVVYIKLLNYILKKFPLLL
mgnify:CR=1 FL=1